ncbi:hypothetical protein C8F01DRAFT_1138660 [Mycena amicta]|nr:hypothetical protein C8F01DRAFT_1138660 [Mycena amicta]
MLAIHNPHPQHHYEQHHLQLLAPAPSHAHPTVVSFDYDSSSTPPPPGASTKRYRSAPAKTFQCAGYGDCRMVFSRSEHLARHIRKHTGERPFTCHCGKQFSRLDNLRQHAQTVHSAAEDKPLNERMMRALAGINASMMAGVRGRRRYGNGGSAGLDSPMPSPYSPSYASSSSSSSPGLSSASSSSSSSDAAYPYDYEGDGHALYAAYAAGCYPSGSHSLPASPSYPSFPTGQQPQYASSSPVVTPVYLNPDPSSYPHSYRHPQTAPCQVEASDYLAAGFMVKQEEDTGLDLDEFYRAVCAPPEPVSAYASSSPYSSASSSPSPAPTSPPESPAYYAVSHPQQHRQSAPAREHEREREMTNAEYYRAVQAQYYYSQQAQAQHAGYAFA